ncbi:hypothetical protein [Chamaesiphon sp.]|uniref:hypothetical protein n=1 Tax=Chamaesiphon sp. TaxID=2814140 RepID=UPI0035931B9E
MGDARRRKKLDPNFGKSIISSKQTEHCRRIISGNGAFVVMDFWGDNGGVAYLEMRTHELENHPRFQLVYDLSRQAAIVDLGIRRQHEQSLGCLTMMDRHFRSNVLKIRDDNWEPMIFNWLSDLEIAREHLELTRIGKGKAVVFGIVNYLINNCNPRYQFPCWVSGVPLDASFVDLIFIVDSRNRSKELINTVITRENYL